MQLLENAPAGWSPEKLRAFNDVISACLAVEQYRSARARIGITGPAAVKIASDVDDQIRNVLVPRLLAL